MRYRCTLVFVALIATACGNPDRLLRPTDPKKDVGEECVDSGPILPGCFAESESVDTPNDIAQFEGPADGSEQLWTGSSDYSTLIGPFYCPSSIPSAVVTKIITRTSDIARFRVEGLTKIRDLPEVNGSPEAEYRIPGLHYVSTDGAWEFHGGTVKARCQIVITRTLFFVRASVGVVTLYNFEGDVYRTADNGSGGGSNRGWAYEDDDGTITGVGAIWGSDGSDPTIVVTTWAGRHYCWEGWDVWINGEQVCSASGG